ncbi:MAG TPA: hypothetical protein VGO06_25785 [Bosea sp. (in: a-proteobacteria)]|uniref:hypothetical protein n=1 Tax=Bosea sp. (in: a-proteobacteria) TaxID=1871050 RepID=UPI002E16091D|nr:hypothetical protein [Bosea sp. (in: a-proteobacteria)]
MTALLTSEVSSAVRRNATVYGLYLVGLLLVVCAVGYSLDALHTWLAIEYGRIAASLWIAGGLLATALVAFAVGAYVKSRRRPSRRLEAAMAAAPVAATLVGSGKIGWKAGIVGGVVLLGLLLGRQLAQGREGEEEK